MRRSIVTLVGQCAYHSLEGSLVLCMLGALAGCGGSSTVGPSPSATVAVDPALRHLTLYVSVGDGYLYALNAATGEMRWRFQTGGTGDSSAIVSNGIVYVGSS